MAKKKFEYAAGISDRDNDWVWQGTVIAYSSKQAKKLLVKYKKINGITGKAQINAKIMKNETTDKIGVYD